MLQLHRVSYKVFDPTIGRLVLQNTPWPPDKGYVESFIPFMALGAGVSRFKTETKAFDHSGASIQKAPINVPTLDVRSRKDESMDSFLAGLKL